MLVRVQTLKDRVGAICKTWGHVPWLEFPRGGIVSIVGKGLFGPKRGACNNCPCIEHCET